MKTKLLLFTYVILSSCSISRLEKKGVYREIDPDGYAVFIKDPQVHIIDVRTSSEFNKSHIPNAINISYLSGDFKDRISKLTWDKSRPILIYCETQHRSLFAAKILSKVGYTNIVDLDRGMINWRKKGYPTDTLSIAID